VVFLTKPHAGERSIQDLAVCRNRKAAGDLPILLPPMCPFAELSRKSTTPTSVRVGQNGMGYFILLPCVTSISAVQTPTCIQLLFGRHYCATASKEGRSLRTQNTEQLQLVIKRRKSDWSPLNSTEPSCNWTESYTDTYLFVIRFWSVTETK
jgi:hypothetical protein